MKAATRLAEAIADRISRELPRMSGARFPSARGMALRLGVSRPVVRTALWILVERGLLEVIAKGRYQIAGRRENDVCGPWPSSTQTLVDHFRAAISTGQLRAGQDLPKVDSASATHGLSGHTVLSAYRCLCAEGLAHKMGRRYLVGRASGRSGDVSVAGGPALLVVACDPLAWWKMSVDERTGRFARTFTEEAERTHTSLVSCVLPSLRTGENSDDDRRRLDELRHSVDTRYVGAVIARDAQAHPGLRFWAQKLCHLERPVVWFDPIDDGPIQLQAHARFLSRAHFDEAAAVSSAVEFLYDRGHRRMVYVSALGTDWEARRGELGVAAGKGLAGCRVWSFRAATAADWDEPGTTGVLDTLDEIDSRMRGGVETVLADLVGRSDELSSIYHRYCVPVAPRHRRFAGAVAVSRAALRSDVMLDPGLRRHIEKVWAAVCLGTALHKTGATALIVPNDKSLPPHHAEWLRNLGITSPRDISLISFDNSPRTVLAPVTTVDFGFSSLGYMGLHAIVGDVPVARRRNGDIPALPIVVDRGSVRALSGSVPP